MKKSIYLLFLALIALFSAKSAEGTCYGRGYFAQFNATKNSIAVQNYEHLKLEIAIDFFQKNCFTHLQLIQIVNLMNSDANKLKLAIQSYDLMEDTNGFYQVQYQIQSYSYRRQFKEFLRTKKYGQIEHGRPHYSPLKFPNYNYPHVHVDYRNNGRIQTLDDYQFNKIAIRLFRTMHIMDKKRLIDQYMLDFSLTTEQFMKLLSLLDNYQLKYDLATQYHDLLYDYENAYFIEDVFDNSSYRQKFRFFIRQNTMPGRYEPRPYNGYDRGYEHDNKCGPMVSDYEMATIITTIKNEPFSSKRVEIAKTIIMSKPGLNSQQIMLIVNQMSFDSHKLEVAKFGYRYAIDRENYFVVANALSFSSNKSELMSFIRRNP